jgi:hypothetical protein
LRLSIASSRTVSSSTMAELYGVGSILRRVDGLGYPSGCSGLRLMEEEIQHVRPNVVRVGDDG